MNELQAIVPLGTDPDGLFDPRPGLYPGSGEASESEGAALSAPFAAGRFPGLRPASCFLALLALAAAVRAEIEFSGVLTMSGRTLFALHDTATERSDWVPLQGRFAQFVISNYDQATETLTLTRPDASIRVRLKDDARVQPSRFELTGSISFGSGEKVEIERATLHFDQENVFPLKDGITYRIIPVRRADGTLRYSISIEQRTAANRIDRLSAPSIVTLPHQSFNLRVGEFSFSFTPKSP